MESPRFFKSSHFPKDQDLPFGSNETSRGNRAALVLETRPRAGAKLGPLGPLGAWRATEATEATEASGWPTLEAFLTRNFIQAIADLMMI